MATNVKMYVEYWNKDEYRIRLEKLISAIEKEVSGVDVIGEAGRSKTFEIVINGKLVYSKLKYGCFPKAIDVIRGLKEVKEGREPKIIGANKRQQQGLQQPNS
ncbi:hypothetical protein LSH36_218g02037 [Paralvinella palmiformis]|uniref:Uncharacterized protein n=1 Tax=Paralvinella palmiformis TaxID=53620 RepID=A0AAD9JPJ7_9ANNE|nr:hypothetical protein LSH36_218g02037 [Paralvinella palmiformis]